MFATYDFLEWFEKQFAQYYCNINELYSRHGLHYLDPSFSSQSPKKLFEKAQKSAQHKAIAEIFELASQNNIKILLFKGAAESDLYSFSSRIYADIDIIVKKNDLLKLALLFSENGYSFWDCSITEETLIKNLKLLNTKNHINPIIKKIDSFNVMIELHVTLKNEWNIYFREHNIDLMEQVFDQSELFLLGETAISRMSTIDRFLFSLQHLSRHIMDALNEEWYYDDYAFIPLNLRSAIDAILLSREFSFFSDQPEYILKKIESYGIRDEIAIANYIINYFFNIELLPQNLVLKLNTHPFNGFDEDIREFIFHEIHLRDILIRPASEIARDMIIFCLNRNITVEYEHKKTKVQINEYADNYTKQKFGTVCRLGKKPKSEKDSSAEVFLNFTKKSLRVHVNIKDDILKFSGIAQPNQWGESFNIVIYNPNFDIKKESLITFIQLIPKINENQTFDLETKFVYHWKDKFRKEDFALDEHDFEIIVNQDGYTMQAKLDWALLGIALNNTNILGMDFVINDVDTNDPVLSNILSWSNPTQDVFNPARLGLIKIIFDDQ